MPFLNGKLGRRSKNLVLQNPLNIAEAWLQKAQPSVHTSAMRHSDPLLAGPDAFGRL
jgi:hypothetical protein